MTQYFGGSAGGLPSSPRSGPPYVPSTSLGMSVSGGGYRDDWESLPTGSYPLDRDEMGSVGPYGPNEFGSPPQRRSPPPFKVITAFPCLLRGGAEQWLLYLAKFFDPQKVQLLRAIVTNGEATDPEFVAELPIPVEVRREDSLRRAARDCDLLMVFGLPCDDLLRGVNPKLTVFVAHGDGPWTRKLLNQSRTKCDHVIAVSGRVAEMVCEGFPTTVIYNGVDSARLGQTRSRDEVRQRHGFSKSDFVVGYLGRFSPEKQPDLLIRALALLPPEFKLLLVGWGSMRPQLMNMANDLIPGRYAFATASKYLGDYYRAMDAFGLVSNQEGFSMALLEAMLCERPLVVTAVGSVPEMIEDHVNGVVVEQTPESIASAVRRLRDNPSWAKAVAAEGHRYAENFGLASRMAREYEALFAQLWAEKHPGVVR